jgi:hypothetical protein
VATNGTALAFKTWIAHHWRKVLLGNVLLILLLFADYAYWVAVRRPPDPRIQFERATLQTALESYKEKFTEYPPSNDPDEIRRHVAIAFPRYQGDPVMDLQQLGFDLSTLDTQESWVLWLAGLPEHAMPTGFHFDVTHPFQRFPAGGDKRYRTVPFYDFVQSRLTDTDNDGWPEYRARRDAPSGPIWYEYDPQKHEIVFSRDPDK